MRIPLLMLLFALAGTAVAQSAPPTAPVPGAVSPARPSAATAVAEARSPATLTGRTVITHTVTVERDGRSEVFRYRRVTDGTAVVDEEGDARNVIRWLTPAPGVATTRPLNPRAPLPVAPPKAPSLRGLLAPLDASGATLGLATSKGFVPLGTRQGTFDIEGARGHVAVRGNRIVVTALPSHPGAGSAQSAGRTVPTAIGGFVLPMPRGQVMVIERAISATSPKKPDAPSQSGGQQGRAVTVTVTGTEIPGDASQTAHEKAMKAELGALRERIEALERRLRGMQAKEIRP